MKTILILIITVEIALLVFLSPKKLAFVNDLEAAGIKQIPYSMGASWADFNSDGYLDLLISGREIRLYKNNGNGTFTETAGSAGIRTNAISASFADFDNDGCRDLYLVKLGPQPDSLYRNSCNGKFTEVTKEAGIKDENYTGAGVAWADYDSDGYLDLYVANHGVPDPKSVRDNIPLLKRVRIKQPNILYHNNKNGTFTDVTTEAKVSGDTNCSQEIRKEIKDKFAEGWPHKESFQPIWFDYNDDQRIDLFIATDGGISPIYRNEGNGKFTEVTKQAGLCRMGTGMGVTAGDYDNDGDMDMYITNVGTNFLWKNNGDGTFTESAIEAGTVDVSTLGWGTNFFDYDNDGDLDLYVVNGTAYGLENDQDIGTVRTDKLYKNSGDGKFVDASLAEGITGSFAKEAGAFADYNNDGFTDIFVGSRYLEGESETRLYKNKGNQNRWITIELKGTKSNKDAIGAKIILKAAGKTQIKEVIAGSSFLSQNSLWQTFGLGNAKFVDEIRIQWPNGGEKILHKVKTNQKIAVVE